MLKIDRTFFYKLHTGTLLFLLLAVSVVTMSRVQPFVAVLSVFSGALSFLCYHLRNELRALLRFCLPVGFVLILFNLLFNRNGVTVLFYVGDAAVTLEAVAYALLSALHFTGAVLWFSFFCTFLDADRVYRLFKGGSRGFAIIFSLSMALVPKTLLKYEQTRTAVPEGENQKNRFISWILRLSALFSWVLEDSFETAVSMKARGALLSPRRQKGKRRISVLNLCLAALGICAVGVVLFAPPLQIEVYPRWRGAAYTEDLWVYIPLLILYFLPCIVKLWEVLKWKLAVQKI